MLRFLNLFSFLLLMAPMCQFCSEKHSYEVDGAITKKDDFLLESVKVSDNDNDVLNGYDILKKFFNKENGKFMFQYFPTDLGSFSLYLFFLFLFLSQ